MAASIEQKVDYLLKKIGYTASKTGIAEDSSLSGTKKAPFAEALPSPLVVPATSIYGQSELIPSTPPGSTSGIVEVYGTATAFQMTEDNTVSGQRSWLARSVQGKQYFRHGRRLDRYSIRFRLYHQRLCRRSKFWRH